MPKQVVPTAGETVVQLPVAMGVHAGSECHTYILAPEAQSKTEFPWQMVVLLLVVRTGYAVTVTTTVSVSEQMPFIAMSA
jgi:hypothetical protein